MKSYGLTKFAAADDDVAGLQAQGAPTRHLDDAPGRLAALFHFRGLRVL